MENGMWICITLEKITFPAPKGHQWRNLQFTQGVMYCLCSLWMQTVWVFACVSYGCMLLFPTSEQIYEVHILLFVWRANGLHSTGSSQQNKNWLGILQLLLEPWMIHEYLATKLVKQALLTLNSFQSYLASSVIHRCDWQHTSKCL